MSVLFWEETLVLNEDFKVNTLKMIHLSKYWLV